MHRFLKAYCEWLTLLGWCVFGTAMLTAIFISIIEDTKCPQEPNAQYECVNVESPPSDWNAP